MGERIPVKVKTRGGDPSVRLVTPASQIYVRAMYGTYQRLRRYGGWALMLLFLLLPWARWNGQQAVLFDIGNRQFHFFGATLFPQDLILLALLFMVAAFALFFFTTFLGRVWCGYTCPQTVWTFIYIWFEEKLEGARNKRIALDKAPWTFTKLWRKGAKHTAWLLVALLTAMTMVAYFAGTSDVFVGLWLGELSFAATFSVLLFTLLTYANAGWLRTIVCTQMCPYARFQAAMFDKDTFIVGYDVKRGEPRGARKRKDSAAELGLGDCVDCNLCVEVCPAGIDIRHGLQYECINCGACVDACDQTMDKMGYARGLISYTTEHRLAGGTTDIVRPKLIGYGLAMVAMCVLLLFTLLGRSEAVLDVLRDRNQLYRENNDGLIENTYLLKILNKTAEPQHYRLAVEGLPEQVEWIGPRQLAVAAGANDELPIALAVDPADLERPTLTIEFVVTNSAGDEVVRQESRFIGP